VGQEEQQDDGEDQREEGLQGTPDQPASHPQ
jgi:hypothetical protein